MYIYIYIYIYLYANKFHRCQAWQLCRWPTVIDRTRAGVSDL